MEFGKGLEKWDNPAFPETPSVMGSHSFATLSAPGALVTLLEAATLVGYVVDGMGYPRPREGLQSDLWDYLRPEAL